MWRRHFRNNTMNPNGLVIVENFDFRLLEPAREGTITDNSRLFITELVDDRTNRCLLISANQIRDNLDNETEPNLDLLS